MISPLLLSLRINRAHRLLSEIVAGDRQTQLSDADKKSLGVACDALAWCLGLPDTTFEKFWLYLQEEQKHESGRSPTR